MLGLKLLLAAVGGVAGVTGFASFSFKDWDPSNVWRVETKNEFYLTTCRQRSYEDEIARNAKWIHSDLSVYLTFQEKNPKIEDGTKLKLIGRGHYKKLIGTKTENEIIYESSEDLHQAIDSRGESRFSFVRNEESGNSWLGEGGGGVDSSRWGLLIKCDNNKIFTFEGFNKGGEQLKTAYLKNLIFSLHQCGKTEYKGVRGCSIKIDDEGRSGLKWAEEEGFKPIVISSSIN